MNNYWKQSLWLGGAYWIISLILAYINTFESYMTDFIFSLLLTIFLIPMIFLSPVKWIDKVINKLPIFSTFLVFVGWVPYLSIAIFLVTSIYGLIVVFSGYMTIDGLVLTIITPLSILTVVKIVCIFFAFIMAAFWVFISKKSVAGCLNNKFRLVGGDSCNMPIIEEAVVEHTKKMYECKKEAAKKAEKEAKEKKPDSKKKEVKKVVKKVEAEKKVDKKAVKKTAAKKTTTKNKEAKKTTASKLKAKKNA